MDWQLLGMEVARQLNLAQGDVAATPQAGGDINRAFRFELGARSFFVKTNRFTWPDARATGLTS
jgi:fructosamine-3-kinase